MIQRELTREEIVNIFYKHENKVIHYIRIKLLLALLLRHYKLHVIRGFCSNASLS